MFNSMSGNGGYSLSDIAAATRGNDNNAFGGNSSWWIILLFIFMLFGWGGNRNNDNNSSPTIVPYPMIGCGNGGVSAVNEVQRGFDQNAIMTTLNAIQGSTNQGFSNAEVSRCNQQANILQTLNNNQMGLYQTMNANQNAIVQNLNTLAANQAQCCCDNRAAVQDVKYTIATENCADRQSINNGVRDIIANQTQGIQSILDKLCQLEMDNMKQNYENRILTMQAQAEQLRADNVALRGDISQANQTAAIEASQNAQTARILTALNPAPIPAYWVPNPNGCNCNSNYNYGCCGN